MARFEVKLPKMGESVAEATITSWLKEVGDTIAMDEAVLEIATDKVDTEVPATHAGILKKILVKVGEVVAVGAPIAIIETAGDSKTAPAETATSINSETIVFASSPLKLTLSVFGNLFLG